MYFSKKLIILGLLLVLLLGFYSCKDNSSSPTPTPNTIKIAVISDIHVYDPTLGVTGDAFNNYLVSECKLIPMSNAIMESVTNSLIAEKPDILLVTGDLTKDGELVDHQLVASYLQKIKNNGTKVVVIPGNHDINNPQSYSFSASGIKKIANIQASDFKTIYSNFGFGEAIAQDPNSLSYVFQPYKGIWILAMDDCKYSPTDNATEETVSGKFNDNTLAWINTQLQSAKSQNIVVIGMVHHGLLEHFTGESADPFELGYVTDNYQTVSKDFADAGMRICFTGHFHANDISLVKNSATSFLFDVETGSTVTPTCPYRIITYTPSTNQMVITTKHITSIIYPLGSKTFTDSSTTFIRNLLYQNMYGTLIAGGATQSQAQLVAPMGVDAYMAHYAGDEVMPAQYAPIITQMIASGDPMTIQLGQLLGSMFTDLNPPDNNVTLNLNDGTYK